MSDDRPLSVVLAGGGTAGHIEPALALADALRRADPRTRITCLGTERGLEVRLVPARGFDLRLIPPVPMPRKPTPELLSVPRRARGAVKEAQAIMADVKADVVVGFGGYVAFPAYLAANRSGLPIVVHEANATPGLANKVGSRMTTFVGAATPDCSLRGAVHLGIPLRRSVSELDRDALRPEAREAFGLAADVPTLLVFGGSQGARSLNAAVAGAIERLRAAGIQVLHAVGPKNELPEPSGDDGLAAYRPVAYLDRMDLAYAAADLAVCRAGAMTVAELSAVGLPAVYVPLPIGNGEQRLNALPVVRAGGGIVVEDAEFDGDRLAAEATRILGDPARLSSMSMAASRFGRRDADDRLVAMVRQAAASAPAGRAARRRQRSGTETTA